MIINLELKLSGQESIEKEDLIEVISSWGRKESFTTNDSIKIKKCESNECYPLENLDISQIDDLSEVFSYSIYNGDLSKWNTTNAQYMDAMFYNSEFNNDSLRDWDVSNVKSMIGMFSWSNFNGDLSGWNFKSLIRISNIFGNSSFNNNSISNWDLKNVMELDFMFSSSNFNGNIHKFEFNKNADCDYIFGFNQHMYIKYNNGEEIPTSSKNFKKWFQENRDKFKEIELGTKFEVLDFFNFDELKLNM